jgi:two-component system, NtrC family, sensor kinase
MVRSGLKTRVIFSFMLIIVLMSVAIALFGYYQIRTNVVERAQKRLLLQLWTARSVYDYEIDRMKHCFELLEHIGNPAKLKSSLSLDYLYVVTPDAKKPIKSPIVAQAFLGNANGGTRVIDSTELIAMGNGLFQKAEIEIKSTPMARLDPKKTLTSALAFEYAAPIFDSGGTVVRVVYGGKIINQYTDLIDRIHRIAFENKLYNAKPIGTVTIFEDDVRIATNVLDKSGCPAIGTRVSSIVYDNVVGKGKPWYSRAFVVTDWYLTAYEPIRDVTGRIVGILYVGALEAPFNDVVRSMAVVFLLIIGAITFIAIIITFQFAAGISRPLTRLVNASKTLAAGNLSHRVPNNEKIREIHELAHSFNEMADKLHARETCLKVTNEELETLNKRYLDLVGMVSHELKGILSSTMLNACSVRDEYLGPVNEIQAKALESITRNLEYFDQTVKNFLNLSRIEKNELAPAISEIKLKENIIDESVNYFSRQAHDRGMTIENTVAPDVILMADNFLLLMVVNNLIGNAVKYGREKTRIVVSGGREDRSVRIEVYSEGRQISPEEQEKLFKRFSRLDTSPEGKKMRGTGLGLFISRQIVEQHGGTISCLPHDHGNAFIVILPLPEKSNQETPDHTIPLTDA